MTWLLCDYGEVLALAPSAEDRAELEAAAGAAGPPLWAAYWEHRSAYDRGDLDAGAYWSSVLDADLERGALCRLVERDVGMWTRPNRPCLEAATRAGRRGLRLAVLSNAPHELADACDRLPWLAGFSPRLFSCRLAATKPDPAAYVAALDALGAAPGEVVFLDDRPANVEAARAGGLRAQVFTRPSQIDGLAPGP